MEDTKLGAIESRFADLIWSHEPLTSGELVKLCREELTWKKSTTYTVLKKLCDRGLFRNDGGTVTAVISREEFHAMQSERFVEETFDGSLPAFPGCIHQPEEAVSGGNCTAAKADRPEQGGVSHGKFPLLMSCFRSF